MSIRTAYRSQLKVISYFLILFYSNAYAQNSSISGYALQGTDSNFFTHVILINLGTGDTLRQEMGFDVRYDFKNLQTGDYLLTNLAKSNSKADSVKIHLGENESLLVNLNNRICEPDYKITHCPKCNSSRHSIRVELNVWRIHRSFKNDRSERKFYKKAL